MNQWVIRENGFGYMKYVATLYVDSIETKEMLSATSLHSLNNIFKEFCTLELLKKGDADDLYKKPNVIEVWG